MAVSLTDLDYSPDGAVVGAYRVVHKSPITGWLGPISFVDGVATDIRGHQMRHAVAAFGPDMLRVERMDEEAKEPDAEDQLRKERELASMPTEELRDLEVDAEEQLDAEEQASKDAVRSPTGVSKKGKRK